MGLMKELDLSIIVPLYNEEESIGPLHAAIVEAVSPLNLSFEILFVDDGSQDNTFEFGKTLAQRDPHVRIIKFRRNYGQTPAMAAGIDHACGKVLITMDGDLQNDPADIPEFLKKIDEGYDIVVGWRRRRQDKVLTRILPSKMANWLIAQVTGIAIKDNGCSLKAYRAKLIKRIPLYAEMHRFIPAMTSMAGARIAQIPVRHHARRFGVSKYGLSRIYKVLFDLLTIKTMLVLASRPLFSFTGAAILAAILSAAILAYTMLLSASAEGPFSIVLVSLSILFASLAIFLTSLGLLAQLIYRTGNIKTSDLSALSAHLVQDDEKALPGVR
jgi:glycosyltransferase involved in cell wall biosynthesis